MPPTIEEVDAFLNDHSDQAFATVVDRLLDSTSYGERWGRHWLDIVRYADTAGDNSDFPIPQIYRYRDWVIDAFNRDLPYDDFIRDQIAGDLRGGKDEQERQARLIATGYIANARRFGSRIDDYPQHLTIEDTLDNLGRAFLGVSLSCARCHDHKFDPITNRDYYALYGIFHSTRYPWPGIELDQQQRDFVPLVPEDQLAAIEKQQSEYSREQNRLNEVVQKLKEELKKTPESEKQEKEKAVKAAEQEAHLHRSTKPQFETAYAVADANECSDVAVQLKGDPNRLGDVVPRRFLTVLGGQGLPETSRQSGRRELAEWILAESNPLTARVIVNRIWQYHFGKGLVSTPNDFGKQGKQPTHPELLDFLATQLRKSGWSIKAMHRMIMLSATYQQSSERRSQAIEEDPSNDWLSSFPRKRLDAESIRDSMLVWGGNLDTSPAGAHPFPPSETWKFTQHSPFKAIYESNRRTVYLMTQRIQRHPYLAIFDGADPSTSTGNRSTTTTPLQALFLLNAPFYHQQTSLISDRIIARSQDNVQRIKYAFELLFSRHPDQAELEGSTIFLDQVKTTLVQQKVPSEEALKETWRALVRSLLRSNEFVYLD